MSNELGLTIDQVSREKGIDPQEIVHAIEDAILTASRKHFKDREDIVARFNRETGRVDLYGGKTVVEKVNNAEMEISVEDAHLVNADAHAGDLVTVLLASRPLGRIEAQTAKQIILQRV